MADLIIEITPEVLREKSSTLSSAANTIRNLLDEVTKEVNGLSSTWIGSASENYLNKFNGLKDDFEKICKDIIGYSDYLGKAAEDYGTTQTDINNMEEVLKS